MRVPLHLLADQGSLVHNETEGGDCYDGYAIACGRCGAELLISTPGIGKGGTDPAQIEEIQRRLVEFLWGSWEDFATLYPDVAGDCGDLCCTVEMLMPGSVVY